MRRPITYIGQSILEWLFTRPAQDNMVALGKLSAAVLGTTTQFNGLAVSPTSPASLQVSVAPGEIYMLAALEATACGTLAADTTHQIVKQGISLDATLLNIAAPSVAGQSINYLIQATFQETDISVDPTNGSSPVVLPFYNDANPTVPYNGPNNTGQTSNTFRQGSVVLNAKPGISATTGSQVTPSPDSGYVGIAVVTIANGQSTITSGNITAYSGAPAITERLGDKISQATGDARYAQIGAVGTPLQGAFRNLVGSATGISAAAAYTIDELVTSDGAGNTQTLRNWSVSVSTSAAAGPGGIDTGTAAGNTWYAAYAISKPDGTKSAIYSLSFTGPSLTNAPGYTKWARIGAFRTDATNKYPLSFKQIGRRVQYVPSSTSNLTASPIMINGVAGNITTPTWAAVGVGAFVPPTASAIKLIVTGYAQTNGNVIAAPNNQYGGTTSTTNPPPINVMSSGSGNIPTVQADFMLESANIYYASNTANGGVFCMGWDDSI